MPAENQGRRDFTFDFRRQKKVHRYREAGAAVDDDIFHGKAVILVYGGDPGGEGAFFGGELKGTFDLFPKLGDIFFRLGAIGDIAEFFRTDFGILPI